MRKSLTYLVTLALLLSVTGMASGATNEYWDGNSGVDKLWSTANNWVLNTVPGTGAKAFIGGVMTTAGDHAVFDSTMTSDIWAAYIESNLDMSGGLMEVVNHFVVRDLTTSDGSTNPEFTMSGGTLTAVSFAVGSGKFNGRATVSGGLIEAGLAGGYLSGLQVHQYYTNTTGGGTLTMSGGTIVAGAIGMNADATVDIIELSGDASILISVVGNLYDYLDAGLIITSDGDRPDADVVSYKGVDYARLTVPEPMTIALLGLGGLFLRRRK